MSNHKTDTKSIHCYHKDRAIRYLNNICREKGLNIQMEIPIPLVFKNEAYELDNVYLIKISGPEEDLKQILFENKEEIMDIKRGFAVIDTEYEKPFMTRDEVIKYWEEDLT